MSTSRAFTLGCVVTSAGQINQIADHSIDPGVETVILRGDGVVDPRFAAVMAQRPMLSFTTTAIARALGYAGISGLGISGTTLDLYLQQYQDVGTRLSGANSVRARVSKGLLVPQRLTARSGRAAVLSYQVYAASSDGTTAPLAIAKSQTMPSVSAFDQAFTVGPASINGTTVEAVRELEIDFGMAVRVLEPGDGDVYPTFVCLMERRPTVTLRTTNVHLLDSAELGQWVAQGGTDSLVYLRKIDRNGTRVANGTAEHVRFSIDDGIVTARPFSSEDNNEAMIELLIEPIYDGTNDVIAVNTATAIA